MTRIATKRRIELLERRLDALEVDQGSVPHRHPEVEPIAGGGRAIIGIIRSIDVQQKSMFGQQIKYEHSPPQEGKIEPVGERFAVYPMPGTTFAWYFQMEFSYPGADEDPVGPDAFTFLFEPDRKSNRIAYPDPRFDPSPIEEFGQRV